MSGDPEASSENETSEGAPSAAATGLTKRGRSKAAVRAVAAPPVLEVFEGGYQVALPSFEGPLDLLLHLIQQHQLDVLDIPIGFVTERYVEYIMVMQELNIDLASEYLVMAATLAHIKSKMLLPTPPADQEDESAEELDPRGELVRRLLEYQKYKQAAEQLGASPVLGRDVFLRGAPAPQVDGPAPLAPVSVFKLFDAFQRILGRVKQTADHHIDVDRISISERILQLTDLLKGQGPTPFENLFPDDVTRADLVVTFLALLEMTRLRMMRVIQEGPLAQILVELTLTDEHEDVLAQAGSEDPLVALSRGVSPEWAPPEEAAASAGEDDASPGAEDDEAATDDDSARADDDEAEAAEAAPSDEDHG